MEVHFQCTIQICRYQCPDQCSESPGLHNGILELAHAASDIAYGPPPPPPPHHFLHAAGRPRDERRAKRSINSDPEVGVNRVIRVVSTGDLTFAVDETTTTAETKEEPMNSGGVICMTTPSFAATLVVLLAILVISCLMSAFLCVKLKPFSNEIMSFSYITKGKSRSRKSCFYS